MSRQISPVYPSLCLFAICIALMISSCSGGSEQQSGATGIPVSGTGGVSFRLVWQQPLSGAKAQFTPSFNACVDNAINTITATVSSGTTTVTSNSWPCSAHGGLISAVPAGTNYSLLINGISSGPSPTTACSGNSSSITVTAGQITDAGAIVMGYIGSDTTKPTVISIVPHSNPTI